MSKEGGQVPKKSFIERMTGTTAQIAALVVTLSALLTQIPSFTKAGRDAFCSVFSCSEAQVQRQGPVNNTPTNQLRSNSSNDKLQALQEVGISRGAADPEWLSNEFTPYPFIADALLTLLHGKRLSRPVDMDVVAWNYEHEATSPRSAAAVDPQHLKAAVLAAYNEAYGEAESDFQRLTPLVSGP